VIHPVGLDVESNWCSSVTVRLWWVETAGSGRAQARLESFGRSTCQTCRASSVSYLGGRSADPSLQACPSSPASDGTTAATPICPRSPPHGPATPSRSLGKHPPSAYVRIGFPPKTYAAPPPQPDRRPHDPPTRTAGHRDGEVCARWSRIRDRSVGQERHSAAQGLKSPRRHRLTEVAAPGPAAPPVWRRASIYLPSERGLRATASRSRLADGCRRTSSSSTAPLATRPSRPPRNPSWNADGAHSGRGGRRRSRYQTACRRPGSPASPTVVRRAVPSWPRAAFSTRARISRSVILSLSTLFAAAPTPDAITAPTATTPDPALAAPQGCVFAESPGGSGSPPKVPQPPSPSSDRSVRSGAC
jgi:hypothetical protein